MASGLSTGGGLGPHGAFAFISFSNLEESAAALQKAGCTLNGQVLQMKYHEETEGPRGRGRGGRGGGRTSVHDRLGGRGGGYRQEQQYAEQQPAPRC